MKKELLMGTALLSTLGAASVAQADQPTSGVDVTLSGNHQTGVEFDSPSGGTDTNAQINDNNFTVSLSQMNDSGVTISSSFKIMDENTKEDYDAGFTLAFESGAKLDILNAGNSAGGHAVSIPGSAGAEGVANTSTNQAPTGLDFMTGSTALGVELHTANDFLTEGLKLSVSLSTDTGADATTTYRTDSHYGIGATYVTDLVGGKLTLGGGYTETDGSISSGTAPNDDTGGMNVGLSFSTTSDTPLTVAVGFADGSKAGLTDNGSDEMTADVVKAGVKYVNGDLTFNVGIASGEADDHANGTTTSGSKDAQDVTSASVTVKLADGINGILGYTATASSDEGAASDDGSAWYIGANMSF